jgi:hypothetical protein
MFSEHMTYTFSNMFPPELALRIRDIFFLFRFYSNINRHKDFSFFILFKCCVIGTVLENNAELLLSLTKGGQFISTFKIVCQSLTKSADFLIQVMDNMGKLIEKKPLRLIKSVFYSLNDYLQNWDLDGLKQNDQISSSSFLPLINHTKKFFQTLGYKPDFAKELEKSQAQS